MTQEQKFSEEKEFSLFKLLIPRDFKHVDIEDLKQTHHPVEYNINGEKVIVWVENKKNY